jgi:hypothetical protein
MFKKGLIVAHESYNLIEKSFKDGFSYYCENNYTYDFFKEAALHGTVDAETNLLNFIKENEIEVILLIQPIGLVSMDPYFLKKISEHALLMGIFLDVELYFESIDRYYAQCLDLVIIVGSEMYEKIFALYGIETYHTASLFDSRYYKNNFLQRDIDVIFIGDITRPNRQESIDYLIQKGINVETYGQGTENGFVTNDKMIGLYNRSKITLNFAGTHNNFTNTPYTKKINSRIPQMKGRVTEASMCGTFILNEDVGVEDKRYHAPEHIDLFKTKEELYDKVTYYLSNDAIREKKANDAYQYSIDTFDSIKGMYGSMHKIKFLKTHEKNIILDNDFEKIYTTHHFYMLVYFLVSFKFNYALNELKILCHKKFNIDFGIVTLTYIKDLFSAKFYLYNSYRLKKRLLKVLEPRDIESFVIYAGGIHTQRLLSIFNDEIKKKITIIYDKNRLLDGTSMDNIAITSSREVLRKASHLVISSFAFEHEIEEELKQEFPSANIIKIYNKVTAKDIFYNPTWYEVYFGVLNKHHFKRSK